MAENGHGGHRTPSKPAPVSGPGRLSRRTDGGPASLPAVSLPDAGYGENKSFVAAEQGAPMGGGPSAPPAAAGTLSPAAGGQPAPQPIPINAPSAMPGQPVTHGANLGPGPAMSSLGLGSPVQANWANVRDVMQALAAKPGASPATQWLASRLGGAY